jgi:hypothetical protein
MADILHHEADNRAIGADPPPETTTAGRGGKCCTGSSGWAAARQGWNSLPASAIAWADAGGRLSLWIRLRFRTEKFSTAFSHDPEVGVT